jgi:NO-binding membrane sensor protein with MHYT domain
VLPVRVFTDGPLIPLLSYVAACTGVFLGLRCATRARACHGASRGRWLLLAAVSIGSIGIWAMNFLAMLGFAVSGETTRYNVPVVIASLLVAVAAVGVGLLIIGNRWEQRERPAEPRDEQREEQQEQRQGLGRALPTGGLVVFGLFLGTGLVVTHYLAMAAMRIPGRLSYSMLLVVLSLVIAVAAATAMLLGAVRLRGAWATLGVSLVLGGLLCGMYYTAMAAVRMFPASVPAGMIVGGADGATASSFLLPVILSVSIVAFLICAAIALSPTEDAIRYDAALLDRIRKRTETPLDVRTAVLRPSRNVDGVPLRNGTPVWNDAVPGNGTRPGHDNALGHGAALGHGTRLGHGPSPGHGAAPGQGRRLDDGGAPGDGPAQGPGNGNRTGQQPPWAIGEARERPESH